MTEPSTPKSIELLIAGYVAGNLNSQEFAEFQQLLVQHPELAREIDRLQATCDRVIAGLQEVQPPPHLWNDIRTAASKSADRAPASRRRSISWRPILGSLAALIILGLGFDNYRLRQDLKFASEIDAMLRHSETRLFSLKHVSSNDAATSGSFIVNLEKQKGFLTIQNLPIPPDGRTYRLWAIVDNDRLPCGQVRLNAQGLVIEQFPMPADLYDNGISGILITLESSQSGRYPTGLVVMRSAL